jgi:ATP-binding cassette, subfamily G (WHITE), eye pigment precursor transporter
LTLDQMRDPNVLLARIVQNVIAVLTLALLYFQVEYDQKGVLNMNGSMFQLITHVSYIAVIDLAAFCESVPTYFREYRNAMYRPDTFFWAKNLADLPIFIILMAMTVLVTYWSIGFYSSWSSFGIYVVVLLLVYQYSLSLNVYFLGVICDQLDLALNIAPPLRICFMLLGGFLVNDASLPIFISWLKHLSWYKSGFELLALNQWSNVDHIVCEDGLDYSSCYHSGEDVIYFLNFMRSNITFDYVMLVSLTLAFRILALIVLALRSREVTIKK